jgi:hypothetical protein
VFLDKKYLVWKYYLSRNSKLYMKTFTSCLLTHSSCSHSSCSHSSCSHSSCSHSSCSHLCHSLLTQLLLTHSSCSHTAHTQLLLTRGFDLLTHCSLLLLTHIASDFGTTPLFSVFTGSRITPSRFSLILRDLGSHHPAFQ